MEALYIILAAVLIIGGISAFVIIKKKSHSDNRNNVTHPDAEIAGKHTEIVTAEGGVLTVPIDLLPVSELADKKGLSEITDGTVIARITQTVPAIAETATRTVANNAMIGMDVYRVILPSGESLAKSKDIAGAFRGFSLGETGIQSQANFVKVDVSKTTAVANGVANVMNIGSMVVGQYYMSEISSKLNLMTKSIDKIGDFQNREFKSRILSVIMLVSEISQFSLEIMASEEQTNRKLIALDNLKSRATELLGQVNITISETASNTPQPNYKEYQDTVTAIQLLIEYQTALILVLDEISNLTYLLGKGTISAEACHSTYEKYLKAAKQSRCALAQWHGRQIESLNIDLANSRKIKTGIEGMFAAIPGVIDDKWKYREMTQEFVAEIDAQSQSVPMTSTQTKAVYSSDVQIIIKDGKYYYLPEQSDN